MYLGCNVYYWGEREQNRLLAECLGPLASRLKTEHLCRRFWFDRFDARGPHLFLLFGTEPATRQALTTQVTETLSSYLAASPSQTNLSPTELAARHQACRGKTLCTADRQPEPADNNTFVLFEHGPRHYPFSLSLGLPQEEQLWQSVEDLTFWVIRQLASKGAASDAAIAFVAALDGALRARGEATDYWRYHAGTLLPGLADRLRADGTPADLYQRLVSEKNAQVFLQRWQRPSALPDPRPLLELIDSDPGRTPRQRHELLREIVHTTLQQLGLLVSQQIPLLLFAETRSAPAEAEVPRQDRERA
jgi:hypothetical protein